VHSVFESAANLRVEGLDYLLTLFVSEDTDLPQGIRLPRKAAAIIRNLEVGQKLQYRSGRLQWAGAEVDLQAAHRYDGAIPPTAKRLWSPETTSAWRTAWDLLAQRQDEKEAALRIRDVDAFLRDAHPGEPRRGDAAPILGELILGMQRLDSGAAAAAIRKLVGLGEGLTPTGDDVLVGLLAAAWARSETDHRRATWVQALAETVREQSHRTNDISRSYLVLAAEGQFSSSLVGLAVAICSGASPQTVRAAAEIAFQTGHTSGLDAATGLLTGLAAWNDI
jgi:hypothetical protein